MVRFTRYLTLILCSFYSKALSSDIASRPATRDVSQFVAGNFLGLLTSNTTMEQGGNKVTSGARHTTITPRRDQSMKPIIDDKRYQSDQSITIEAN